MQRAKFYGEILKFDVGCDDHMLKFDRIGVFYSYLNSLEEGQRIEIEIRKESEDITHDQYEYYFACIVQPLAESLGYIFEHFLLNL